MRNLGKMIRTIWHDLYYFGKPSRRVEFALRCREAAEIIDLNNADSVSKQARYHLHLSICQPCQNYFEMTRSLKRAVLEREKASERALNIELLNKNLVKKYAKKL